MLPILMIFIGTLPHNSKGASQLSLFILCPFHIAAGAFCMNVYRTVGQAFRAISFTVMSAIFRIIRVIVTVR